MLPEGALIMMTPVFSAYRFLPQRVNETTAVFTPNSKGRDCGSIGECCCELYNGDIEEKTEAQPLDGLENLCGCASDAYLCSCVVNGTRRSRVVSSDDLFLHTCIRSAPIQSHRLCDGRFLIGINTMEAYPYGARATYSR